MLATTLRLVSPRLGKVVQVGECGKCFNAAIAPIDVDNDKIVSSTTYVVTGVLRPPLTDLIFVNSGQGCINCSGIWASRHTKEIAEAIAERIGPVEPLPPEDLESSLAAFTVPWFTAVPPL